MLVPAYCMLRAFLCSPTMTSAQFSFDEFDSLMESALLPVTSTSGSTRPSGLTLLTASLSQYAHGESPSLVVVKSVRRGDTGGTSASGTSRFGGASVTSSGASGGPPSSLKQVSLLFEPAPAALCMGTISASKFCIKPLLGDKTSCGAVTHSRKFQPPNQSAFLKENEIRAYCTPAFDLTLLSSAQRLRIQGVLLSVDEWLQLFEQVRHRVPPKWLAFDEPSTMEEIEVEEQPQEAILTPSHAASSCLLGLIPTLSFDSAASIGSNENVADVTAHLRQFRSQFSSLREKWTQAFTEVEAGYSLVVRDLQKLHHLSTSNSSAVGAAVPLGDTAPTTLWQGLSQLHQRVETVSATVQ